MLNTQPLIAPPAELVRAHSDCRAGAAGPELRPRAGRELELGSLTAAADGRPEDRPALPRAASSWKQAADSGPQAGRGVFAGFHPTAPGLGSRAFGARSAVDASSTLRAAVRMGAPCPL